MASKNDLLQWSAGATHYAAGEYAKAVTVFKSVVETVGAKMQFNIGMCYSALDQHDQAIEAFSAAVKADRYFAVAYFQRGVNQLAKKVPSKAVQDFNYAADYLRGNAMIDYTQLGMPFRLYYCEVVYNRALTNKQLNYIEDATEDIGLAKQSKMDKAHMRIDDAMPGLKFGAPFAVPKGTIYRPPENKVKATAEVDYLGSAKIVAAIDRDNITGFKGPQVRKALLDSGMVSTRSSSSPDMFQRMPVVAPAEAARTAAEAPVGARPPSKPRPVPPTPPASRERSSSAGPTAPSAAATPSSSSSSSSSAAAKPAPPPAAAKPAPARPAPAPGPSAPAPAAGSAARPNVPSTAARPAAGPSTSSTAAARPPAAAAAASSARPAPAPQQQTTVSLRPPAADVPPAKGGPQIKVKCHYKDLRVLFIDPTITHAELVAAIAAKFECRPTFKIRYVDEDNEQVLLTDQEDLGMALATADVSAGKLELWCA